MLLNKRVCERGRPASTNLYLWYMQRLVLVKTQDVEGVIMQEPIISRDGADEWGLDSPKITDLDLIELLRVGESDEDRAGETPTVVSTTYIQPALMGICHYLRKTERVALTKIHRLATKHGLLLIKDDSRYAALENSLDSWLNVMRSRYDADMNVRLHLKLPLHLKDTVPARSATHVYSWVHGALVELGYDAGLQLQDVTMFCILVSLGTVPFVIGGYAPILQEDIERFWRHVTIRSGQLARAV